MKVWFDILWKWYVGFYVETDENITCPYQINIGVNKYSYISMSDTLTRWYAGDGGGEWDSNAWLKINLVKREEYIENLKLGNPRVR